MSKELTLSKTGVIVPQTFSELMEYAKLLAESDLVPKDFRGKPGNIVIAVQMGAEVGLSATQSLQSIGIVNGKPSIYGDGAAGLVRSKGNPSIFKEYEIGERGSKNWKEWNDDYGYACEIKRRGSEEITKRTFTVADAKRAGLWGKTGNSGYPTPWVLYPQRMLMMRARSWAMRDSHPDVLKGLSIYEEAIDIEPIPEPDKATISIDDFKPKEKCFIDPDDWKGIEGTVESGSESNSELQKGESKADTPKVSLEELRDRIFKACIHLGDGDIEGAKTVYHQYADIINPKEEQDEKGNKSVTMERVVAKDLKEISIEQARVIWGKVKKDFKERSLDIKKIIGID